MDTNTTTTKAATAINPALLNRDFTLILDESGSMDRPLHQAEPAGISRWKAAKEAVYATAVKLQELQPTGISLYPFNQRFKRYDHVTADQVEKVLSTHSPDGGTRLAPVLDDAFRNYLDRKAAGKTKANGEIIVVATDGEPEDPTQVAKVITNVTKHLTDPKELQLIVLQIGDDADATKYLNDLDDHLEEAGAAMDIVSVLTYDSLGKKAFSEFLVDAIVEHKIVN